MRIQKQLCISILVSLIFISACSSKQPVPKDVDGRPLIIKLGTIDVDLVETTPIVFNDKLYRFEYVRKGYWNNKTGDSYFRFIDHEGNGYLSLPHKISNIGNPGKLFNYRALEYLIHL
jgi:hypothetical protein